MSVDGNKKSGGNMRVVGVCLGVTFGMLGMAYAAVPLYQIFCQVTGYAGTTQRAEDSTGTVLNRTMTVRFDSNISSDLDWEFAPSQREITLRVGDKAQAFYTAKNLGGTASKGTATFNVSPGAAGVYFNKIECFCFTEQELAAGQSVDMPVLFFIDPDIVNDPLLKDAGTITLSYTFFPDDDDDDDERELTQTTPSDNDGGTTKSRL
jgi:cytochrome c oxidase assembly protein subunit 11